MGCRDKKISIPSCEDNCLCDLRKKLKQLINQFISVTISGCCDIIQGRILRVDEGSLILVGEFGTRIIPLCSISSFDACQVLAYVTNSGFSSAPGNTVSVIDTTADTVIDTITVGTRPIGVAITPDGKRVYVTNQFDDSVSVINTTTNSVIETILVGNRPLIVAITPDGTRAYVSNFGDNTVSVIDTESNNVSDIITEGPFSEPFSRPFGIAIANTSRGVRAYVANSGNNTVFEIDANANSSTFNTVIRSYPITGVSPIDAAITPEGTGVYFTNVLSNDVTRIDTTTENQITIQVGDAPSGVGTVKTTAGTRVYVLNSGSNTISVIDADPNSPTFETVIATISKGVGFSPSDAEGTPDGTKVYVPNNFSNNVSVIDTATNIVIASIPVGVGPGAVAVGRVCR